MKRLFFCFIVLILCFQIISAIDTNVQVKTVPLKNVNLVISTNDPPYISNKDADEYGDVSFVCPSDNPRLDLTIFVKDIVENKKVAFKKLENQIDGYRSVIQEKQREATTFERDIAIIDAQISKAKLIIFSLISVAKFCMANLEI